MRRHFPTPRRVTVCAALILACAGPASTAAQPAAVAGTCQESEPGADPRRVVLAGGRVSLVAPEGVRRASDAAARHYATGYAPELFMTNEDGSELIFVLFRNEAARPDTPSYQAARVRETEALAGFGGWISRQVVAQGGTRWLRLEYIVRTAGGEARRHRVYFTAFQGRTLLADFYTDSGSQAVLDRMAAAGASLALHDCVPAGDAAPAVAQRSPRGAPTCEQGELRARVLAGGARRVALADARVSLVPPDGTEERFSREPSQTFHADQRPLRVYGGDSATLALWLKDGAAQVDSPAFRDRMRQGIERNAVELHWIAHDVVEMGGARWLRLEFTHRTARGESYAALYLTPFQGLTLVADFQAVPRLGAAMRQSAATMEVRDCRVQSSITAWVDSAALLRAAATLPAPRLPAEMKPLFLVFFDRDGALVAVEPAYEQIPADYAAAVTSALRANLKPQPAWREVSSYVVRVQGGPAPLVDSPDVTASAPQFPNAGQLAGQLGHVSGLMLTPPSVWRQMPESYIQVRVTSAGTVDERSIGRVRAGQVQPVDTALRNAIQALRVVPAELDGFGVTTWVVIRPRT